MIETIEGLMTEQEFLQHFEKEIQSFSKEVVLIKLNIDDFETVNRFYGEHVGDQVIQKIAKTLDENLRESDLVCRTHKDEFMVMMLETPRETGHLLIEEIRTFCDEHTIFAGDKDLKVRFSAGLSSFPQNGKTTEELLATVDEALKKAKSKGKNQTIVAASRIWVERKLCITREKELRLSQLAGKLNKTEAGLMREGLEDLFTKYEA